MKRRFSTGGGQRGQIKRALGIPAEANFVARYFAEAIPTTPLTRFHIAVALFRFAVIFIGIADRARAGNAAADNAEIFSVSLRFLYFG